MAAIAKKRLLFMSSLRSRKPFRDLKSTYFTYPMNFEEIADQTSVN